MSDDDAYDPDHYLDDDDYDEFIAREMGRDGGPKGPPPIGVIVALLVLGLIALSVVVLT